MKILKTLLPALTLGTLISCNTTPEIAQWSGPERNGIFPAAELFDSWPEEGPELLWTFEGLGLGYASPAVTGERIYVNGEENGEEYLFALDLEGELLWKVPKGKAFLGEGFSSTYPGARSTPTVYGDRIYSTSGQGQVSCFHAGNGEKVWSLNIVDDLQGQVTYFGYSESPVVDRDHVYIFPGGQEHNIVALDRQSGELSWTSTALRDTFAYGSPILVDLPAGEVLVSTSRHHISVLDKNTGQLLSSYGLEGYEYDGEHCNSVQHQDGYLYFVANDVPGQGAMKIRISDDGTSLEEVWRNPEVMNNFGGFLVIDGSIWTTLKGNKLVALDPLSGEVGDSIRAATGSLIAAGDRFINYGYNGKVHMVGPGESGPETLGEMKVTVGSGHHFSHPVVAGGVLYIRRGDALAAYRIG